MVGEQPQKRAAPLGPAAGEQMGWLRAQCEGAAAETGQPWGDLAQGVCRALLGPAADDEVGAELFDLIGEAGLSFIGEALERCVRCLEPLNACASFWLGEVVTPKTLPISARARLPPRRPTLPPKKTRRSAANSLTEPPPKSRRVSRSACAAKHR